MYNSDAQKISLEDLFYYRERNRNKVYAAVVSLFSRLVETQGLTKRELAYRLDKEPAQITRWLSGPSNWTLDTVSDLMLAMGAELDHCVSLIGKKTPTNLHPLPQDCKSNVVLLRPDGPMPPEDKSSTRTTVEPFFVARLG